MADNDIPTVHQEAIRLVRRALRGHSIDGANQDSGHHCKCGSDSRFVQQGGDLLWDTIDEHRAQMVVALLEREAFFAYWPEPDE